MKRKKKNKNFFAAAIFFKLWDHFFTLLFLKDAKNVKSLDIGFWEVGAKKNGKRSEKHRNQKSPAQ